MTLRRRLFLSAVYEFLAFISFNVFLALTIAMVFGAAPVNYSWLMLVPFYFLSFVRLKAKNIFAFVILNLSPFALLIFLRDIRISLIYGFFCSLLCIYSFSVRVNRRKIQGGMFTAVFPVGIVFFGMLLDFFAKTYIPAAFFTVNASLAFICAIIVTHVSNIDNSLENLTLTNSQPVKPILDFNNRAIAVFVLLTALAALLSTAIRLDFILPLILRAFIALMKWFFSLFSQAPEPETTEPVPPLEGDGLGLFSSADDPSMFFIILEKILFFVMYTALVALVLFAIGSAIYTFYKKFYALKQDNGDKTEFAAPLYSVKKERFILKRIKSIFPVFDKNARIRKLFYKKVKSYLTKGVKLRKDNTAQTIAQKIERFEDIHDLTQLYEKARYGEPLKTPPQ